jgi:tetratricopeptide (TPR) repeat protein
LFAGDARWVNRTAAFEFSQGRYAKAVQLYAKVCKPKAGPAGNPPTPTWVSDGDCATAWDGYLQAMIAAAGDNAERLNAVIREAGDLADTPYKPAILCRVAQARLKLGDRKAAGEDCRRVIEAAGAKVEDMAALVRRLVKVIGADEAARQADQILAADPNSLAGHWVALEVALARDAYDQAVAESDRCLSLVRQDGPAEEYGLSQKAQVLTLAFERTSDNRYLQEGIAQYESLLAKMPTHSLVLNNLAYLLAQSGAGLARSLELAKKAYEGMPNSPVILDTYGYVLYKHGRYQEAMEILSAACQQSQIEDLAESADVYEHLGMVREALGDRQRARQAYQRALEVGAGRLSSKAESNVKAALGRLAP